MFRFLFLLNFFIEVATCSASSLVGVRISAWICPLGFRFSIIAEAKANVFPLPVAEPPIMSLPAMARGIAFF